MIQTSSHSDLPELSLIFSVEEEPHSQYLHYCVVVGTAESL